MWNAQVKMKFVAHGMERGSSSSWTNPATASPITLTTSEEDGDDGGSGLIASLSSSDRSGCHRSTNRTRRTPLSAALAVSGRQNSSCHRKKKHVYKS